MVVLLKDKRGISIVNAFQWIISEGRKPNKIWVDQGGEFYKRYFKRFLKINTIVEMYSTHNEGKSVVTERFIKMLKSKIFKHMKAVSNNVYFDVLDKFLLLAKLRIQLRGHTWLMTWMVNQLLEVFMKNNCKKDQEKLTTEKIIKRKYDKLFVKWKGYDSLSNSWIDKKDLEWSSLA